MNTYSVINKKGPKLLSVLKDIDIDIDYCCDSEYLNIYTTPEKAQLLSQRGYELKEDKQFCDIELKEYHGQEKLQRRLIDFREMYPSLCHLDTLGQSVEGRDIFVFRLTSDKKYTYQKPSFLWLANMHGNEVIGREMSLMIIDDFIKAYNRFSRNKDNKDNNDNTWFLDQRIHHLLDNVNIYLIPSLNPDGFEYHTEEGVWKPQRYNAHGIDLNRNFPNKKTTINKLEPETQSLMAWMKSHHIHLSASIHGGSLVVNYPYERGPSGINNPTNYDSFFRHLAREFTINNPSFIESRFHQGITNGSQWYAIDGSFDDWRFDLDKGMGLTLELSKIKMVSPKEIKEVWDLDKPSVVRLLENIEKHIGIFDGMYVKRLAN